MSDPPTLIVEGDPHEWDLVETFAPDGMRHTVRVDGPLPTVTEPSSDPELWEMYEEAEGQFSEDYFWSKHGHETFMAERRARTRPLRVGDRVVLVTTCECDNGTIWTYTGSEPFRPEPCECGGSMVEPFATATVAGIEYDWSYERDCEVWLATVTDVEALSPRV